jgi:hypothetical protein
MWYYLAGKIVILSEIKYFYVIFLKIKLDIDETSDSAAIRVYIRRVIGGPMKLVFEKSNLKSK